MSARAAERAVQVLAIACAWLAFYGMWAAAGPQAAAWRAQGVALPALSTAWLAFAGHAINFIVPAAATAALLLLALRRSAHVNWLAGAVLVVTVAYLLVSQLAMALPAQLACGCIR